MNLNKKTKKASIFLATLSIILLTIFGALTMIYEKPIEANNQLPERHLFVEEIYLLKTYETNKTINITCTPYLTNIWTEKSGDIKVIAYVVKQSNKVADCKNTVNVGKINADSTAEIEIPLQLSDDSYKVDILIFEDEKLVLKGSLQIKTTINFRKINIYNDYGNVTGTSTLYSWDVKCESGPESFEDVEHDLK